MTTFGALSYGTSAIAFALLTVLLVTSWRGRQQGARLIGASVITAAWAGVLAMHSAGESVPLIAVYTLEILRDGAWILVLTGLAHGRLSAFLPVSGHTLWVGLLLAGWWTILAATHSSDVGALPVLMVRGGLLLAIVLLVLLEQVFRNASPAGRRGLKYLALGLGGLYAYDLFLYSQAELLQAISAETWQARGFVTALLVPAFAVAARRNPDWSLDVFVSRHVVFYTGMVVAAGVYLLLMAVGGYYIREIGGTWGAVAEIVFLAGAAVVLGVLVLSGTIRRRVQVFISKHFYRNKYDYRVEWLRFIETLSRADAPDPRRNGLQAIAQIFDAPGAVLLEFDESGRVAVPVAAWPMRIEDLGNIGPVSADDELARFLRERQWVVDVEEHRDAPDVYQNIELPAWLTAGNRFRIVVPLLRLDQVTGLFVLYAPPPPFKLTFEDRDLLKTVGRHVATHIAQHEADRRLAEAKQFEAYNRLTAFMMHDLKNAIAQLQLIVRNAERHRHNPEFIEDAMGTIGNAVERLTQLVEQLRAGASRPTAQEVLLVPMLEQAMRRCAARRPVPRTAIDLPPDTSVIGDIERLTAVIEHVIRNAQDATPESGSIVVGAKKVDAMAVIDVTDSGSGMSADFLRERLFRPFDSTKGSKGMGIGAYQVREYARSIGGDVKVESVSGAGTRFSIKLPVVAAVPDLPAMQQDTEERALGQG